MGPKAVWPSSENCRPNWVQSKCLVKPAWLLSYFSCLFLFVVVVVVAAVVGVGVGCWWWWVVGGGGRGFGDTICLCCWIPTVCIIHTLPLKIRFFNPEETSRILITKDLRKKHPPTKNLEVHIYGGCGKKIPCGSVARSTTTRLTYLDLWNEIRSGKKTTQDV